MWNTRRKRLKAAIERRNAKKEKLEESEEEEEAEEDIILEPPPKVYPGIPQLKLEEINRMASKYKNSNVRLSIKARDAERITKELIDLRDEVIRLRQCVPAASFIEEKSLIASEFSLEVPSELDSIEIHDLDEL